MSTKSVPPEVLWAQRSNATDPLKNLIYLTVRLVDPEDLKINLKPTELKVFAKSRGQQYELDLEFFGTIDEEKSRYEVTGSHLFFILFKKELKEEFWPRLTKEKLKLHFLHTDFDKWVDEDEQEEVHEEDELQNSMADLNSFGGDQAVDFGELARKYGGQGDPAAGSSGPSQYGDFNVDQFSSSEEEEEEEEAAAKKAKEAKEEK
ncbi:unnamed protein product [Ambrosiozyma monospora]|uniref:Unnamed protein product n=1 Tax=Ambrosiozyma monospora TaxID=43982 RepID=A0ACB5SSQ8_AMBMO|nr:unnamed protein product [Ambrosiozyma monospora]